MFAPTSSQIPRSSGGSGREAHEGHGEVRAWNTGVLSEKAPYMWRLVNVITQEGSERFAGDSKKNWLLVMPYDAEWDAVESNNRRSWRETDSLRDGSTLTFWIGWNDDAPKFLEVKVTGRTSPRWQVTLRRAISEPGHLPSIA